MVPLGADAPPLLLLVVVDPPQADTAAAMAITVMTRLPDLVTAMSARLLLVNAVEANER
jgi:hypothetical protein